MELAIVFGSAGVLLVLVALIGGGFEFGQWKMPKVGKIVRAGSFSAGGVFLFLAIGMAYDSVGPPPGGPTDDGSAAPTTFSATVMVQPGYVANLFANPQDATDPTVGPAATLDNGAGVEVSCTIEGPPMTSAVTGKTSSLWDGTTTGYFIPDVAVFTGTDQPVAPSCTSMI
jgi:hypothetical protein